MSQAEAEQFFLISGKTFIWHELYVPDAEAAIEFYTSTFGFGVQRMDMGEMGTYNMLTKDGQSVCGVLSTNSPHLQGVPPHWAVYTTVDDVDAKIEAAVAKGSKVMVPAMNVPTIGRMALIADPQGAHIWLFKPEPRESA